MNAKMFAIILLTASVAGSAVAGQEVRHVVALAALTDVTECRAGCQGGEGNCQESLKSASFVASDGYQILKDSEWVVRHWNAPGSPGLRAEPRWEKNLTYDGSRLLRVTIKPILASCVGVSPHTQGVTFYEFQMLQKR